MNRFEKLDDLDREILYRALQVWSECGLELVKRRVRAMLIELMPPLQTFTVVLLEIGKRKVALTIAVRKIVRATGIEVTIAEAKAMVELPRATIVKGVSHREAAEAAEKLQALGATVEIIGIVQDTEEEAT
jgi:hypothetical protein